MGIPMAQQAKKLPEVWEPWAPSLGGEVPLEKGETAHSSILGHPRGSAGKEATHSVGALGSIPGSGRSPGEGRGSPPQYSGLENPMDCRVHGVTKSQTRLSDFH